MARDISLPRCLIEIINKKLKLKDYQLIQDAFNLNTMSGLRQFIKHVFLGTLLIELIGAILYMFVFIPDYGVKGVWLSIFNSVSAFCNAGMDVIGEVSLCEYATNPLVNFTTSLLINVTDNSSSEWLAFIPLAVFSQAALANKETCSDTVNKNNFNNLDLFKQKYFIVDIILYYSHFLLIKVEINNEY